MPQDFHGTRNFRPFVCKTRGTKILHFSISDVQSQMRNDQPTALMLKYTRIMMGFLLFSPAPTRLTMVGLGGGSLAKFCHKYLPSTDMEIVEINSHVIGLRGEFEVPDDSARFRVIHDDASDYMCVSNRKCDVIISDGFNAEGLPANLCSRSFYDNCYDLLEANGLLVANLHGDRRVYYSYIDRLMKSFSGQVVVIDDQDGSNVIVFAYKGRVESVSANSTEILNRMEPAARSQIAASLARVQTAVDIFRTNGFSPLPARFF
jgi:spermidine synthase